MRKTAYKAGKTIIKEGEKGSEAYIIVDGHVEVTRKTHDGSEIVLAKLGDNQMFGEICMIDDTLRRSATVRALTDVVVAVIPQESFLEKFQNTPGAVRSILKVLAKRLADTNDMFIDLHSKIQFMVIEQVGNVIQTNKQLLEELKLKNERITELEEEIEQLKITGPPRKAIAQGQKMEKDRSMKISLKELDNIAKQQQDNDNI